MSAFIIASVCVYIAAAQQTDDWQESRATFNQSCSLHEANYGREEYERSV